MIAIGALIRNASNLVDEGHYGHFTSLNCSSSNPSGADQVTPERSYFVES